MVVKDRIIGIIYVENRTIPGIFNKEAGELLTFFGNQCAVALENFKLIDENKKYASSLEKMVEERTIELHKQKKFNENIIEHIGEILITVDNNNTIVTINKVMKDILNLEPKSFVGKSLAPLYAGEDFEKITEAVKSKSNVSNIKCQIKNSAGESISFSATVSPIIEDGNRVGSIIINTDMTEVERYEKIKLEKKELDSITKAAVTANDQINTPLGVIIGRAAILANLIPDEEKVHKNLDIIKAQAYRIRETLDEMKKITKIKEKEYKLEGITMLDLEISKKNK